MTLLERLKELAQQATPGPWDRVGFYNVLRIARKSLDWELVHPTPDALFPDEEDAVFIVTAINALPALIEVVEAAGEYISKRVEYAGYERQYEILKRVENKTTMQEMEMSTVDAEKERAELESCDAWDNLYAALARLEVEA